MGCRQKSYMLRQESTLEVVSHKDDAAVHFVPSDLHASACCGYGKPYCARHATLALLTASLRVNASARRFGRRRVRNSHPAVSPGA